MTVNDFKTKMLYDQTCVTEEGVSVLSSIYAIAWTYPGALSQTTARIRLTCVFSYEGSSFVPHAATIEKWRNEGWSMLDEYHDDREYFVSPHDFRKRILKQTQSFLTGVPLDQIDIEYVPTEDLPPVGGNPGSDKKTGLSIVEYKKKKTEKSKGKKESDKDKVKDNLPDGFDWI